MAKREYTRALFIDADGVTRDFERWSYKRISTAKAKTVELMQAIWGWKKKDFEKSGVMIVSFGTVNPDAKYYESDYTEQEKMSFADFVQIVEGRR